MTKRRVIEIPIEDYTGQEIDNDARAEMAGAFLEGFRTAHYWHESPEPMETVISDFVADLMHYVDRLTIEESDNFDCVGGPPESTDPPDPDWKPNWDVILDLAYGHYSEEVEEERRERENAATEAGENEGTPT